MSIPASVRRRNRIQVDLIRRFAPELKGHPYGRTPPYASLRQERWGQAKIKLQRKLPIRPTPKERAFDTIGWSRAALRPVLEDVLYDSDATFRHFLDWGALKPVLDAHFSGTANHGHVVSALGMFETACRLWTRPAPAVRAAQPVCDHLLPRYG